MTTIGRSLCVASWLWLMSAAARAEPPTPASVETLLELSGAPRALDALYAGAEQALRQRLRAATANRTLTPEQQQAVDAMPARLTAMLRDELRWDTLKTIHISVYRDAFDQAEVDEMIAFYRSPTGRSLVAKQPLLMQRTLALTQTHVLTFMPRMQAALKAGLEEAGIKP